MLQIKRVYAPPAPEDGLRVLVDGLWPRGLAKKAAAIDVWPIFDSEPRQMGDFGR